MQEIDGADTTATIVHVKYVPGNEELDDDYADEFAVPPPSPEPTSSKESSVSTARWADYLV